MSFKEANIALDKLYEELALLCIAKENCKTFEDTIIYETQIAELEYEIERVETYYYKYI